MKQPPTFGMLVRPGDVGLVTGPAQELRDLRRLPEPDVQETSIVEHRVRRTPELLRKERPLLAPAPVQIEGAAQPVVVQSDPRLRPTAGRRETAIPERSKPTARVAHAGRERTEPIPGLQLFARGQDFDVEPVLEARDLVRGLASPPVRFRGSGGRDLGLLRPADLPQIVGLEPADARRLELVQGRRDRGARLLEGRARSDSVVRLEPQPGDGEPVVPRTWPVRRLPAIEKVAHVAPAGVVAKVELAGHAIGEVRVTGRHQLVVDGARHGLRGHREAGREVKREECARQREPRAPRGPTHRVRARWTGR